MPRTPKSKRGRPVTVGATEATQIRCTPEMVREVEQAAEREACSVSEWWRRAARQRLSEAAGAKGLPRVCSESRVPGAAVTQSAGAAPV